MNGKFKFLLAFLLLNFLDEIAGHGMLWDPVNRASLFRFDSSAPPDYNDMEGFCGGFAFQWQQMGGKCGLCGDKFSDAVPRAHEFGGKYGKGKIVKTYSRGSVIQVTVRITAAHRGNFYFNICNLDNERESEACFDRNKVYTAAGADSVPLDPSNAGDKYIQLRLPSNLSCRHCVMRWTYVAGNNWGVCADGSGKVGCGPQETFRSCSDISIN